MFPATMASLPCVRSHEREIHQNKRRKIPSRPVITPYPLRVHGFPCSGCGAPALVAPAATPLDHTSILKTVEVRWGLPSLTARDAAAMDLGAVLTLGTPRTDDPLAGVVVPSTVAQDPAVMPISHLEQVHAELVARLPVPDRAGGTYHAMPQLDTSAQAKAYIDARAAAWEVSRRALQEGVTSS